MGAGSATTGTLPDPMNSKDYYSFAGTKGETIQITASTSSATGFDPAYPNLVVVLYNASQTQIALDDDPWPRVSNAPNLWTVLPATGMYFILVEECNAAFGASFCGAASAITNHGYSVRVRDVGGATAIPEGSEPGNSAGAGAAPVTYTKAGTAYAPLLLYGLFQTAGDVDMYTFTVPADAAVPPGARARADFWIQPSGSNGDGSASPPGTIFVVDPATNASSVSQIDDASYGNGHTASAMPARLSVPVVLGKQYLLSVSYAQATAASDFYFVQHFGGADPAAPLLEQEPNDAFALADTLSAIDNLNGTFTFQIDGDLAPAGIDIDVHKLTIAPGLATISGACQARRLGSGLSGLTYSLLQSDAVTVIATQTESATSDLQIAATPVSAGAVYLKVSASAQVANVTDSSYICKFLAKP